MREIKASLDGKLEEPINITEKDLMDAQIIKLTEAFKETFTKEELAEMEKKYDAMLEEMNKRNDISYQWCQTIYVYTNKLMDFYGKV